MRKNCAKFVKNYGKNCRKIAEKIVEKFVEKLGKNNTFAGQQLSGKCENIKMNFMFSA